MVTSPLDRRLHAKAGCYPSTAPEPADGEAAPALTIEEQRKEARAADKRLSKMFNSEMVNEAFGGHYIDMVLKDTLVKDMPAADAEAAAALMDKAREIGNTLAGAEEFEMAARCYTDAIEVKAGLEQEELRGMCLSNRAQMRLKLKQYAGAVDDAGEAVTRLVAGGAEPETVFKVRATRDAYYMCSRIHSFD